MYIPALVWKMGHGWHGCFWADSKQWGLLYLTHDEQEITLPITSNGIYIILGLDNDYGCDRFGTQASASNKFKVWERSEQGVFAATNFQWVAICRQ